MKLTCIRDNCPKKEDRFVDYRRCCNCEFFHGQDKIATVECSHMLASETIGKGYQGKLRDIFPILVTPYQWFEGKSKKGNKK